LLKIFDKLKRVLDVKSVGAGANINLLEKIYTIHSEGID
jgi:hypothetical protein